MKQLRILSKMPFLKQISDIFKFHGVKLCMLAASIGFFVVDRLNSATCHSSWFITLLILFQIRGIVWEEKYREQNVKLSEENELLRER